MWVFRVSGREGVYISVWGGGLGRFCLGGKIDIYCSDSFRMEFLDVESLFRGGRGCYRVCRLLGGLSSVWYCVA